jgi:hypothetical protein
LSAASALKFNYGVFSARTGDILTASLLKQWVYWATGEAEVPEEVWEKEGRYYDPFRPEIEPKGFLSADEVRRSRARAIEAFRGSLKKAEVFVFTLGHTESWWNRRAGYEYPVSAHLLESHFDGSRHEFTQQDLPFIRKNLNDVVRRITGVNPGVKILLTVSPVPLAGTLSGHHVLLANTESKSILRAVVGGLCRNSDRIDYFPSFEMMSAAPFRGIFYEANQSDLNAVGVNHMLEGFFSSLAAKFPTADLVCEGQQLDTISEDVAGPAN